MVTFTRTFAAVLALSGALVFAAAAMEDPPPPDEGDIAGSVVLDMVCTQAGVNPEGCDQLWRDIVFDPVLGPYYCGLLGFPCADPRIDPVPGPSPTFRADGPTPHINFPAAVPTPPSLAVPDVIHTSPPTSPPTAHPSPHPSFHPSETVVAAPPSGPGGPMAALSNAIAHPVVGPLFVGGLVVLLISLAAPSALAVLLRRALRP